ncbi:TPA: hypothetical protein DIV55_03575 [Patescibacteria group bacterium]|uniref:Uncharacterized protein n=1 Tax=Candidatus Gottesmanbacteria bacterium GW2011_GWA1_43_11 TaxID=1618436 RepID=A0A0G1FH45_9BACT|nr:MAG: hypothetical protein UV59_C0002G0023 [Candidatus Gottesmanbacteria bacterium GW2011_GWA1_43_11]HCS78800.1 hypothetical protein [Patescibacteria group bacterium]
MKFTKGQYQLLSRYAESISKASAPYNVVGYFLPSVLPSVVKPSISQVIGGVLVSLTGLVFALILEGKIIKR